jgi:polyhydroxyalkanoate synthesis regulator phasin
MTLFQSPEYIRTLNKTLDTMSEFSKAKKEILQDFLNMLPVPTHKEMDELYKEIYLLKKRIKELEKKI